MSVGGSGSVRLTGNHKLSLNLMHHLKSHASFKISKCKCSQDYRMLGIVRDPRRS